MRDMRRAWPGGSGGCEGGLSGPLGRPRTQGESPGVRAFGEGIRLEWHKGCERPKGRTRVPTAGSKEERQVREMKQTLPLKGIRVVDLTTSYAGPFCTMLLADMGAEVIKIEEPCHGDDSRAWGPPFCEGGISPWFLSANRNKKSVTLNLRQVEGLEILKALVAKSDVFVVSMSKRVLNKMGLSYGELSSLNQGLIFCSITGFGQTGPYSERLCYDLIAEGIGGIMSVTGDNDQPQKVGTAAGDILAAHHACFAIAACLYRRQTSGRGEFIDVCLLDSIVSFVTPRIVSFLATGELPRPDANRSTPLAIYQPVKTKDGFLNLGVGNDRIWERLCRALGLEEMLQIPQYATNAGRRKHREEIVRRLEEVLEREPTQYWFNYLGERGVPCGPIYYLNEVAADPHVKERGLIFYLEHEQVGLIPQVAPPWKLDTTEERFHSPPPNLGEHDDEVLREWLGMRDDQIQRLRERGVIRKSKVA